MPALYPRILLVRSRRLALSTLILVYALWLSSALMTSVFADELNEYGRSLQKGISASENDRPEEAIYWFRRGRDYLEKLPPSPEVAFVIETTNLRIADAMIDANRCADAKDTAETAGQNLRAIGQRNAPLAADMDFRIARVDALYSAANATRCLGDAVGAVERLEEAKRLALSFGWSMRSKQLVRLRLALIAFRVAFDGDAEKARQSLEAFISTDGTILADDSEQRTLILSMLRDFCAALENRACVARAQTLLADEIRRNLTKVGK